MTAKAISLLAEFDQRKLHLPLGYTSSFAYCTTKLGLSQDEAFLRIKAARIACKFPVVFDYLESGAITLTNLKLLVPHLTGDNHVALLKAASHQRVPAVELLVARLKPKPDVPSTIRKLPPITERPHQAMTEASGAGTVADSSVRVGTSAPPSGVVAAPGTAAVPLLARDADANQGAPAVPQPLTREIPSRRPIIQPLSDVSYRLQITLTREAHDTLRQIQGLIRHIIPTGDPAAIVARSLDLLLADLRKKKAAQTARPRPPRPAPARGRRIPAHVQRQVWERDGGRCAFVSDDGLRCDADGFVEFHHVKPYARGGKATAANIQLRCRTHNQYEAEVAGLKKRA